MKNLTGLDNSVQIKASSWRSERKNNVQTITNASGTEQEKIHIMKKSLQVFMCVEYC